VGNPSPTLNWYLNGLPANQSGMFSVIHESVNDTALRSIISVNQPQERDLSTLLCRSFNYVGSATQQFWVNCFLSSSEKQGVSYVYLIIFCHTNVYDTTIPHNHHGKSSIKKDFSPVSHGGDVISEVQTTSVYHRIIPV